MAGFENQVLGLCNGLDLCRSKAVGKVFPQLGRQATEQLLEGRHQDADFSLEENADGAEGVGLEVVAVEHRHVAEKVCFGYQCGQTRQALMQAMRCRRPLVPISSQGGATMFLQEGGLRLVILDGLLTRRELLRPALERVRQEPIRVSGWFLCCLPHDIAQAPRRHQV